jgi:hypothetical protein
MTLEERHLAWYGNLLRFVDKHFSPVSRRLLRFLILAGLVLRWLAGIARGAEWRRSFGAAIRLVLGRSRQDSETLRCVDGSLL